MNIGVLGLLFKSPNKGCEALTYSFLHMVNEMAMKRNEQITITVFGDISVRKIWKFPWEVSEYNAKILPENLNVFQNIVFKTAYYVSAKGYCIFLNNLYCDCVIDFTQGDSFTDMYGQWRFYYFSAVKKAIIRKKIPFILGSQTIGPFYNDRVRKYAGDIIKNSYRVFVRDILSYEYTLENYGVEPIFTTDIALALPYERVEISDEKIKVGINVSGLLWNERENDNDRFELCVDYRKYCRMLISSLLDKKLYRVYLIAHVIVLPSDSMDDDWAVIQRLHREFPETVICPVFNTPIEAKNFISSMDIFTGARMHAAIAAFSSGVPVIPFSYSRKCEGFFDSLKYPFVIHGKEENTQYALENTLDYIENRKKLEDNLKTSMLIEREKIKELYSEMERALFIL